MENSKDEVIYEYQPLWGNWYIDIPVGKGSFGSVYKLKREDMGHQYTSAVKIISIPTQEQYKDAEATIGNDEQTLSNYFEDIVNNIVKEINVLYSLSGNSNVINYQDHMVVRREDKIGWDVLIKMEYVTSLRKYLSEHQMTKGDVIRLGKDICKALELCSTKGIVHRDLKDENIFVNEEGLFKLGDFGIARELSKSGRAMSMRGTPLYMAPEVMRGEKYDASVDIYALGLLMYKLLNHGRMPFMPSYPNEIRYKHSEEALEKRTTGEAMPMPDQSGEALGQIILKACAFKADDRYQSAAELRQALGKLDPNMEALNQEESVNLRSDNYDKTLMETGQIAETGNETVGLFTSAIFEKQFDTEFDSVLDKKSDAKLEKTQSIFGDNNTTIAEDTSLDLPTLALEIETPLKVETADVNQNKGKRKLNYFVPIIALIVIVVVFVGWRRNLPEAIQVADNAKESVSLSSPSSIASLPIDDSQQNIPSTSSPTLVSESSLSTTVNNPTVVSKPTVESLPTENSQQSIPSTNASSLSSQSSISSIVESKTDLVKPVLSTKITFVDSGFEARIREYYGFGSNPIYPEDLSSKDKLNLDGATIESLDDLKWFVNLKRLECQTHTSTTWNLSSLNGLSKLEVLWLDRSDATGNLSNLSGLSNLKLISLGGASVTGDLSSLSGLGNLEWITLEQTSVTGNLSNLSRLSNLRVLGLEETSVTGDLSSLSRLSNLNTINLSGLDVKGDLDHLSGLINLELLFMYNTRLTGDLSSLSGLKNLCQISLSYTDITGDLSSLSGLTKLDMVLTTGTNVTGSLASHIRH